jgi:hypothetical protein
VERPANVGRELGSGEADHRKRIRFCELFLLSRGRQMMPVKLGETRAPASFAQWHVACFFLDTLAAQRRAGVKTRLLGALPPNAVGITVDYRSTLSAARNWGSGSARTVFFRAWSFRA